MELELNVYKGREIEKTYRTDTYDLMFGTVEDIVGLLDDINLDMSTNEDYEKLFRIVTGSMDTLKPFLKDIFEGLTDEEMRRTRVKEIIPVLIEVFKYSLSEIGGLNTGKK